MIRQQLEQPASRAQLTLDDRFGVGHDLVLRLCRHFAYRFYLLSVTERTDTSDVVTNTRRVTRRRISRHFYHSLQTHSTIISEFRNSKQPTLQMTSSSSHTPDDVTEFINTPAHTTTTNTRPSPLAAVW